ncbi:MAG: DUF4129 domain-containing protein [Flavobacterium sp.]|uniref:DUF4129 domain-containing protein n=1 Tax=Flavobacterium sp. TaxID=239 RepID=UPI0011F55BEE|nr:DUF4129 domain-containing protein [Flavobacterium sp.]RZJ64499.1 MAG: DUF4129 domain-containing protein [Flavobacterium sp.]
MYKFLLILLLLSPAVFAQDSIAVDTTEYVSDDEYSEPPAIKYTIKDIKVDSSAITQAHFRKNFKKDYKAEEFDYAPKEKQKTALDRFKAWLARLISELFSMGGEGSLSLVTWIFRIVCGLVILFVIYLIVKAILNKEGKWVFGRSSANRIYGADEIEKNLQEADFEKLVSETMNAGDKRLSIRYYYLWLLQRMSRSGIIEWDVEKTNSDYLYEIRNEKDKENFAYLSYLYNYVWYGEFETDDATFDKAVRAFQKTIKST